MKKLHILLLSALSFFVINTAHADYVCQVTYWPSQGTPTTTSYLGSSGYLRILLATESSCLPANRKTYYLCSENSTDSSCASSSRYEYNLTVLMAHFQALRDAAQKPTVVSLETGGCEGGVGSCLLNLNYWH